MSESSAVPNSQEPRPSSSDPDLTDRDELTIREEPPAETAKLDKMSLDTTAQAVLPWELRKRAEIKAQRAEPTLMGAARPPAPPKRGSLWVPIGIAYALVAVCGATYLYFRGAHSPPPPPPSSAPTSVQPPRGPAVTP